jgi:hypothetical protein
MAVERALAMEKLVRITICAYRKEGLSEKEFHRYWADVHGPLAREWFHRCGIVRYVQVCGKDYPSNLLGKNPDLIVCFQYHSSPEQRQLAQKMMSSAGKHKNLDYDALIDVYVRDFQHFVDAFEDPLYLTEIRPDEDKFCDTASMILSVGTEYTMLHEGEKIEEHAAETWWRT